MSPRVQVFTYRVFVDLEVVHAREKCVFHAFLKTTTFCFLMILYYGIRCMLTYCNVQNIVSADNAFLSSQVVNSDRLMSTRGQSG